ncbi:MAG: Spy/CpxP family protein refolding chaperone [Rhizomicrobium sp.]
MSGALFAGGAATHVLAADRPHDRAAENVDPVAWHKQMCVDRYARNAGRVAYIEARLSLTDNQRPLFDNWKKTVLGSANAHESECLARQPHMGEMHGHSILERQARMRQMMQRRLADLTAEQPSLKGLYDSLSPEQRLVLDHGGAMAMRAGGPHGHGDWRAHGPRDGGPDERAD